MLNNQEKHAAKKNEGNIDKNVEMDVWYNYERQSEIRTSGAFRGYHR